MTNSEFDGLEDWGYVHVIPTGLHLLHTAASSGNTILVFAV
jgi:hypothetical protein